MIQRQSNRNWSQQKVVHGLHLNVGQHWLMPRVLCEKLEFHDPEAIQDPPVCCDSPGKYRCVREIR